MTTSARDTSSVAPPVRSRSPHAEARDTCARCRRPTAYCWCPHVPTLDTRTDVVFFQHPRERDVAIGTARMAHLALPRSKLVVGVELEQHATLRELAAAHAAAPGEVAVLFPGADARPLEEWLATRPPRTLVVLDGTWSQAKKLLTRNPTLAGLPRLSYRPPAPGNYRIRKEPSDEHLATIEAVAAVLGALEGDPSKFSALLEPFTRMVDMQLAAVTTGRGPRRLLRRRGGGALHELQAMLANDARAVVVYAESNAHPPEAREPGAPELIHLVAARYAPGGALDGHFSSVIKPRRPLSPRAPANLRIDEERFVHGEPVAAALERYRAFVDGATLCLWGPYARDLLVNEGEPARGFVDMRALAARSLKHSPGGILGGAAALGVDVKPAVVEGRGGIMLAHLEAIFAGLLGRARAPLT